MQQIVFKREFSVLFDAIQIENVQYLEENKIAQLKDYYKQITEKKIA